MTTAPQRERIDPTALRSYPLAELFRRLANDITSLVRGEIRLAKQEVSGKLAAYAAGAAGIALGAAFALFGLGALVAAAVLGLANVFAPWLSALIIGGALVLLGAIAALVGIAAIKGSTPPVPTESIDHAKEDLQWVRQRVTSKQS